MKKTIFIISLLCMIMSIQHANAQKYYAANWWNTPPDEWQFFAGADMAFPGSSPAFGVHAGMVKNVGFYGRILLNGTMKDDSHKFSGYIDDIGYHYMLKDGKANHVFQAATIGGMLRLWCPIYLNVGVGLANSQIGYELRNGEYIIHHDNTEDYAFGGEAGLSLRINNLMIGAGYMNFNGGDVGAVSFNFSYCF
ncbi:hypothetical protein L6472_01700 [Prevotella sp. E13-17]|uniref:hypothetical protein n=1 Tax=Prevotella sp. E13-17 TaxID=2913616 RepID=UPI001ED9FE37|nr:hypothetical protein [Prevotella sp. E13-17]UKK51337.1 hypothetical protein L6472_01700 [Prevotella sp. E13-17]